MITAIYSHGKNKKNRNNSILFVVIIMFVAYAVGCITTGILSTTDYLSELFEMLMLISQNYGYVGCFFALFLPKFLIIAVIYFSAYFCFGKATEHIILILLCLFYGRFAGYLYSEYNVTGVLIFVSSFLLFWIIICFLSVLRISDSMKISSHLYRVAFLNDKTSFNYNNKNIAIKTLVTLLIVLIAVLFQALILKIVIYILV